MKATVTSPANIAFIKYWGRKDHKIFLPLTTTNSMNLSNCTATTTIEFSDKYNSDTIEIRDKNGKSKNLDKNGSEKDKKLFDTLERIRELSDTNMNAKVISQLSFPLAAGIASSAAGMSAFVAAGFEAAGMSQKVEDREELSREVRLSGSVSAARSVMDGFTECLYGETHEDSYTQQIVDENHWDLVDLVEVLNPEEKKITSSKGHEIADTSPFYKPRIDYLEGKPELARKAILEKDFASLAELSETDTINMHAIMMTSDPMALYFSPGSIDIIKKVVSWRQEEGIDVFYTFDAGPNPHVITTSEYAEELKSRLEDNKFVQFVIANKPCKGTRVVDEHLF